MWLLFSTPSYNKGYAKLGCKNTKFYYNGQLFYDKIVYFCTKIPN